MTLQPKDRILRRHNLSAGPSALPLEVLREVQEELLSYGDAGASIMEVSHRSDAYSHVEASARARLRRLLKLPEAWHILFMQGGASGQFALLPMNALPERTAARAIAAPHRAAYVTTGVWSEKAFQAAKSVGEAYVAASSIEHAYRHIPSVDTWAIEEQTAYVHITSNNTIYGTRFREDPPWPNDAPPLVCDASSDFLSRPIHLDAYRMIYAGAQKNLGPAGVTVVLIHDDFLRAMPGIPPTIFRYSTHAGALYHTPPVFAIYVMEKVLAWIEARGGLDAMAIHNAAKAQRVYDVIDAHSEIYEPVAHPDHRSWMNLCFRLRDPAMLKNFLDGAALAGIDGLAGHRSVGGLRASLYNAATEESVDALTDFLHTFATT